LDVTSLAYAPGAAAPVDAAGGQRRDVNKDGFMDLVSRYWTDETGIGFRDAKACITGRLRDGVPFAGCDDIQTVPAPAHGKRRK
jgi:hypothetical protein